MVRLRLGVALLLAVVACASVARAGELDDAGRSKKARFLLDKHRREPVRLARAPRPGQPPPPVVSLLNTWTNETLPVEPARPPPIERVSRFLRCHFTNQTTAMDPRLLGVVLAAARRFKSEMVEIVSGFRAPKYNLYLRKKGHEVARESEHPQGHAVDFRIPNLPTNRLLAFVRSLHLGGVGYYPASKFVHADVGRVRFWRGH